MTRLIASLLLFAFAAACSPADAPIPQASETGPVLSYTDAFVMEPIAGRNMTMGGVTLSVEDGDVRLVSATSDAVGTIELHTMSMTDGKMTMRQVEGFDLADGGTLSLQRGGNHMMMFDVSNDVTSAETVDILLNFDANGTPMTLVIEADVRAVGE